MSQRTTRYKWTYAAYARLSHRYWENQLGADRSLLNQSIVINGQPMRPYLHHNPDIAGAVLRIFIRAVRTTLCRTSPGAPRDAQLGALSFLHRFGSSLNAHFHFLLVARISAGAW